MAPFCDPVSANVVKITNIIEKELILLLFLEDLCQAVLPQAFHHQPFATYASLRVVYGPAVSAIAQTIFLCEIGWAPPTRPSDKVWLKFDIVYYWFEELAHVSDKAQRLVI